MSTITSLPDVLCFSHLRWNFVFQRPQHLMSRFAQKRRVFYLEEPIFEETGDVPYLEERVCPKSGVRVVVPHLSHTLRHNANLVLQDLTTEFMQVHNIRRPLMWFYTAMALESLPASIDPSMVIYDCMDELSAFQHAPAAMKENENRMFALADLVFTGGVSLFEAKRDRHPLMFPFPSGVDVNHFAQARSMTAEIDIQRDIPHPRIGFAGVIDERMDLALLTQLADLRPDWHFVMVGPVVKIDPATLPVNSSIHWLGMQNYSQLPGLLAGWDVAMMPFAMNESTRFISPTKTPEYLAAGLPVVSTPIRDVVRPYGKAGLATIAATAAEFACGIELALIDGKAAESQRRADEFLKSCSWDDAWGRMNDLIEKHYTGDRPAPFEDDMKEEPSYV